MAARGVLPGRRAGRISGATGGKMAMRAGPEWRAGSTGLRLLGSSAS